MLLLSLLHNPSSLTAGGQGVSLTDKSGRCIDEIGSCLTGCESVVKHGIWLRACVDPAVADAVGYMCSLSCCLGLLGMQTCEQGSVVLGLTAGTHAFFIFWHQYFSGTSALKAPATATLFGTYHVPCSMRCVWGGCNASLRSAL
jgi:hypothetical protein